MLVFGYKPRPFQDGGQRRQLAVKNERPGGRIYQPIFTKIDTVVQDYSFEVTVVVGQDRN